MALITAYWGLDGLIVLTTLMVAAYLYMTRKFNYWKKKGVMEVKPIPFLGNFADFLKKAPGYFIKDLYDQAKGAPYIGFYILDKPFLLIRDRELVKNILVKDFNYFSDRYASPGTQDRLGYSSLFFIKNPAWKALRTKLTPIFTSGKLKKMYELMEICGENLDTYLDSLKLEGKGKEIEVKDLAAKFTTDIIGCTAYGLNVNSLNNPDAEFRKYGKMIFDYDNVRGYELFAVFFLPDLARMIGIKTFGKDSSAFLRKVFWETINHRMESGEKRNDLIDILIDLKKTYGSQDIDGFKFDGDDLVAQAAVFFTGGFETASTTIAFTLYELTVHADIQSKLRKEIYDALEKTNGKITYDMVNKCYYYRRIFRTKKNANAAFLDRIAVDTYKIPNSDLVLEKGMPVYISMLGMHFDPEYFPDPEKFDPERFSEENKRNRPPCVYFPFGEGPRICIGARLGLLQTKLGLIKILSKYELSPSERTLIPMVLNPKAPLTSPLGRRVDEDRHFFINRMALITDCWGQDVVIVVAILIIIAYLYMTRNFKYWQKRGILELSPTPFFGNFAQCLFLRRAPADFLKDLYDRAKGLPYVGFYVLDKPFLLLCDRELVKNIMIKDFNQFSDRYSGASPTDRIGYATLFFLQNPAWKIVRNKLSPFFTSGKLKNMFNLMLECGDNLEKYLESLGLEGDGKTIEVIELIGKFTTDIVGSTAYGLNCNSFKYPNTEFRKYARMIFTYTLKRAYELLSVFFLPHIVRMLNMQVFGKETTNFMRKVFWETFTARMESNMKRNDLIDILVELKKTQGNKDIEGFKFDGDDLLAQPASFFSAGSETTAVSVAFLLHQLAVYPDIQTKLRSKILDALSKTNGEITYDMTMSLPYLEMVVSESLRMYPPLGYLNRIANNTYKMPNSDLVVEKGTPIFISMLGMHFDPEYFPNPNKFDPERFTEENKQNRPSCVYFPFGDGPHMCIGTRFAYLQMKLSIIKILAKFEIVPCEKTLIPMVIDQRAAMTSPLNGVIHLNIRRVNTNRK
ncbi:Cytochrome P450 6k1 [Ooceraea biroi]|uniref:Cytochrome P450 6k1 n=1 Tax=Ooceraea biroi TaxID=2015173 RepID=A0A026X3A5_OOCBI|nr:Cytochrome P450 6k1 [Ooceraea biroi]